MVDVGKNIRAIRTAQRLSQEQLAQKLFVTRQAVSNWETGKTQPDLDTLEQIAAALNAEATELIYGSGSRLRQEGEKFRGFLAGVLLMYALWILSDAGVFATVTRGLSYQLTSRDYSVNATVLEKPVTAEIPLRDFYESKDLLFYEDEDHRITPVSLVWNNNDDGCWELWFESEADVHIKGSTVLIPNLRNSYWHSYDALEDAALTITADGVTTSCTPVGKVHPLSKKELYFGYTLFPGDGDPEHLPETAKITLDGLLQFETRHLPDDIP